MKLQLAPALALLAWLALAAQRAFAAEPGCSAITIEASAGFREQFPGLEQQIRADLALRANIDACAHVVLNADLYSSIQLAVTLPDGRSALRRVTRSDDVLPTLRALVLVPDEVRAGERERLEKPRHPTAPSAALVDGGEDVPRRTSERSLGFELSLMTGARLGDGQFAAGAGVLSFLELRGWLFGFLGRADRYQVIADGEHQAALELGLLTGRRFDFGSAALDLTLGPAVAVKGVAVSESDTRQVSNSAPPSPVPSDSSTGPVPRLVLAARCGFSPHSLLRSFVGLDAELGPTRAGRAESPDAARLPRFELGLIIGATVGTR